MSKGSWREFDDSLETFETDCSINNSPKIDRIVRVKATRGGKGGKTVTIITGLGLNNLEAKALLKKLKAKCSTGGTLKKASVELQGDQVERVINFLRKEGYRPKKAGG